MNKSLWVLWERPKVNIPKDSNILSFLSPLDENDLLKSNYNNFISGRKYSQSDDIRSKALNIYTKIVAQIGISNYSNGQSFRSLLANDSSTSRWWFHPVSIKDSEGDPTLDNIIHVLTIVNISKKLSITNIHLCGSLLEVEKILSKDFFLYKYNQKTIPISIVLLKSFASRIRFGIEIIFYQIILKLFYRIPCCELTIALTGFWDWSFSMDYEKAKLYDYYFKSLKDELYKKNIKKVGYFAWFDPKHKQRSNRKSLRKILEPLNGRSDVVLLQAFLKLFEIIRELVNFQQLSTFLKASRKGIFDNTFINDGMNWYPIFKKQLLCGFIDASIPHYSLVMKATEIVTKRYKPIIAISFLEHFPFARAYYAGIKQSSINTVCWTIQHASYNQEKTIYYLHPQIEFNGFPDGYKVPTPDRLFVMGKNTLNLFKECGYSNDQLKLTGSTRYDHILASQFRNIEASKALKEELSVLLVCTLNTDIEIDMVEAVGIATEKLNNVKIRLRNHPSSRLDKHRRFYRWKNRIEISQYSLDEDLSWSDLIIFSYSTVAEEAIIRKKPVWQWLPKSINGSALSKVINNPRFSSVCELREALNKFIHTPLFYTPLNEDIQIVTDQIFYPADGLASKRIADACANRINNFKKIM